MEISSILHPDCVLCAVQGSSKKRILELISQVASQHLVEVDQATILASLSGRENGLYWYRWRYSVAPWPH